MAVFFVGQRVRVKYCYMQPSYNGAETVITGPLQQFLNSTIRQRYFGYSVGIDPKFGPRPEQLEPILGDDLKACDDDFKRDLDRLLERQGIAA